MVSLILNFLLKVSQSFWIDFFRNMKSVWKCFINHRRQVNDIAV